MYPSYELKMEAAPLISRFEPEDKVQWTLLDHTYCVVVKLILENKTIGIINLIIY
jgi:hypothetical protein